MKLNTKPTPTPGPPARRLAAIGILLAIGLLTLAGCGETTSASRNAHTASEDRSASSTSGSPCEQHLAAAHVKGRFAFIRNRGISILGLPSCQTHVLLAESNASSPIAFSANGRYLAYGKGTVIRTAGSPTPRAPLGKLVSWAWSPTGDRLAGATAGGGVEIWRPGGKIRQLIGAGWGATDVAFPPRGNMLAVTRSTRESHGGIRQNQLWSIDLNTGTRKLIYRIEGIGELAYGIAGVTSDGRQVLVWPDVTGSASLAFDGMPLAAVPIGGGPVRTLVHVMLTNRDYIATCNGSLVVAAGSGRYTTTGKRLVRLRPPAYHLEALRLSAKWSWITPSCSENGEVAASATRDHSEPHFGLEHKSIWLFPSATAPPRRLTLPHPKTTTDELPRISRNGRYILYIVASKNTSDALGERQAALWAIPLKATDSKPIGPIAQLGTSGSSYGQYGWGSSTAWHQG